MVGDVLIPATWPPVLPPAPTCLAVSSCVPRLAHARRRPVCLLARPAVLAHLGLARQLLCGGTAKGRGGVKPRTGPAHRVLCYCRQAGPGRAQSQHHKLGKDGSDSPALPSSFAFWVQDPSPERKTPRSPSPAAQGLTGSLTLAASPARGRASPASRGCPAAPLPLLAWKPGSSAEPLGHQPSLPSPRPEERCCEQMPPPPADVAACISSDSSGGELGREAGNAPSGFQRLRTWPPPAKAPHGAGSRPPRDSCPGTKCQRFPARARRRARSPQPCRDRRSWERAASGGSARRQSKVSFAFSKS